MILGLEKLCVRLLEGGEGALGDADCLGVISQSIRSKIVNHL